MTDLFHERPRAYGTATVDEHLVTKQELDAVSAGVPSGADLVTAIAGEPAPLAFDVATLGGTPAADYATDAEVAALLAGKADTSHTHTSTEITDFATAVDARAQTIADASKASILDGVDAAFDTLVELKAYADTLDADQATALIALIDAKAGVYREQIGGAGPVTVTHNLGNANVTMQFREGATIHHPILSNFTATSFDVAFAGTPPAAGAVAVIVTG